MLVKHVAVEMTVDGDSVEDLNTLDLTEFYSLKELTILINDERVCQWVARNLDDHPQVTINTPNFCKTQKWGDDNERGHYNEDVDNGSPSTDAGGGGVVLRFGVGEIIGIVTTVAGVIICGMVRKYIK